YHKGSQDFSKEPPTHQRWAGVSTYLALTFGTLLSSQGTDASFVLTLSGFPPGFRSAFRVPDSIRLFRVRFPADGILLFVFPAVGPFRRPEL
ncbi:hypothetical protein, partial [Streptomyces chryseus]|uniref:hypothetical protein n=1 Tax=Streptomyces chryseus TaxID=68186 RepID=UPI001ABF4087